MATNVQSFWPRVIRPKILSPLAILRGQAEALATQTGGVLLAEVTKKDIATDHKNRTDALTLDIVVPALSNYRHRILRVVHAKDQPYPAIVEAEIFRLCRKAIFEDSGALKTSDAENRADTDQEFIALVKKVLGSPQVLSAAQSLIARATDALVGNAGETLAGNVHESKHAFSSSTERPDIDVSGDDDETD